MMDRGPTSLPRGDDPEIAREHRPIPYLSDPRQSRSFHRLEQLAKHPKRLAHLSVLLALLELDAEAWNCVQYLRQHSQTADTLRVALPQLYLIPDDMVEHLQELRAYPDWDEVQDLCIRTVAAGTVSASNPDSYRASGWSPRSSSDSTNSTSSGISRASSQTSHNSHDLNTPSQKPCAPSPMDQAREDGITTPIATYISSTNQSPVPPPKLECPLTGCNRVFKQKKRLENHMKTEHGNIALPSQHATFEDRTGTTAVLAGSLSHTQDMLASTFNPRTFWPQGQKLSDGKPSTNVPGDQYWHSQESSRLYNTPGVQVMENDIAMLSVPSLLPPGMYQDYPQDYGSDTFNGIDASAIHAATTEVAVQAGHQRFGASNNYDGRQNMHRFSNT